MKRNAKNRRPPSWAISFLEWFCPDDLLEGVLGDLLEQYDDNLTLFGHRQSGRKFIWQVIRLFHPSIILRNHFNHQLINMGILKNSLKVAVRSMRKYAFYSGVNIFGLSLAFAFTFLAFRFIRSELAFDQFHTKSQNIYRLYHEVINKESKVLKVQSAVTAIPLSKDIKEEVPFIVAFTRVGSANSTIQVDDQYYEEKITYVDPGFFRIFDFPILKGQYFSEEETGSILLSEEQAMKLYGRENPIGKIISVDLNGQQKDFKIAGVVEAASNCSSLQFEFLAPMDNMKILVGEDSYHSYNYGMVENYILTNQLIALDQLSATLNSAIRNRLEDDQFETTVGVQPLQTIHLENKITGNAKFTNPQKLYIVGGLSLLVITIAVINFIILSTSHSLHRSKEMGIRSTLGAQKVQLKKQMITESFFLVLLTGIVGVLFAALVSPYFSHLINGGIIWSIKGIEVVLFLTLCLIISLVNGNLQALFLLRQNAIQSLRGHLSTSYKSSSLNEILLGLQIVFSILLFIGAIGMQSQMRYIQNKDLGYEKERLLEINLSGASSLENARQAIERFRTEILRNPEVINVSASMNNVKEPWTQLGFEQNDGKTENLFYNQVDPSYVSTMDMTIVQGENFRIDAPNANNAIIVNETLVKHFGWKDPLQEQLPGKFTDDHHIIGVVKDFHFSTMHQKIEPLVLALDINSISSGITGLSTYVWPANLYQILVRVGPGDLSRTVQAIEAHWKKIFPEKAFVFHFFDDSIDTLYQDDLRWSRLIDLATLFAVIIAGMGLLGLMRLNLQKRKKEIGIRRVLGASTHSVITLVAKRYLILIALGNFIALPLAFFLLKRWLDNFSYRIDLQALPFFLAGISILLLSFLLLGLQSLSTVRSDLNKSLKEE